MCCTLSPATLSDTILFISEAKINDKLVHVLGYQNHAQTAGPNAMILPFPTLKAMGQENAIDTSECPNFLEDLKDLLYPPPDDDLPSIFVCGGAAGEEKVKIFNVGSYTVVMSRHAKLIHKTLDKVPVERRPKLNYELFEAYAQWYPLWPIAVCCFNGNIKAEPLMWWYEPRNKDEFFLPGLDSHSGDIPLLHKQVMTDHCLMWGSCLTPSSLGVSTKKIKMNLPEHINQFVPETVNGVTHTTTMLNGDWKFPVNDYLSIQSIHNRYPPPGAF